MFLKKLKEAIIPILFNVRFSMEGSFKFTLIDMDIC